MSDNKEQYKYWLPNEDGGIEEVSTNAHAIIFIGANGAGKSRLGAWIEQQKPDEVHRIGAQRDINFHAEIPIKSYSESENMVLYAHSKLNADERVLIDKIYKYGSVKDDKYVTYLVKDFDDVLSALIAKTSNENEKYVEKCKKSEKIGTDKPKTPIRDIDKLKQIWSDIFPQRELIYDDYKFFSNDPNTENADKYSATKMSDGERSALYFIAQVLCVPEKKILLIDEPEMHLHRSLMNRLWTALENIRQDCLFIYITHDTQFAAMHEDADKYWVKSYKGNNQWEIEPIKDMQLPEDMLLELLGNKKNVLFVEGTKGSLDIQFYSLIYKDYYIIPCGSCLQVIEYTKALNNMQLPIYYKAYGIIDRDYRSDEEIKALKNNQIYTLDVAEIENLFLTEELIKAVASFLEGDPEKEFNDVKKYIIGERFKKEINKQICNAVVYQMQYYLSRIDLSGINENDIPNDLKTEVDSISYESIYNKIKVKFNNALNEGYRQVIQVYNQKRLSESIGHYLSLPDKKYREKVMKLLRSGKIDPNSTIGKYMPDEEEIPR